MSSKVFINELVSNIKIPFSSIINKYRDFFNAIIIDMELSEEDQLFYMYN